MKVMTCQQLGGPCAFELRGATADEVIKAQDRHLQEVVAEGDETHQSALKQMKGRWKRPSQECRGTARSSATLLRFPKTD